MHIFKCEDGTTFKARFYEERMMIKLENGRTLVLPQMVSGSGIRYATPRHEFRGKGDDAWWTVGRKATVACRVAD